MPIKLDCPRCKNPLVVPTKMAGAYATCPRCQGRFWVPDDAPQETFKEPVPERGTAAADGQAAAGAGLSSPSQPPGAASLAVPPGVAPPRSPAAPPQPPAAAPPRPVVPTPPSPPAASLPLPGAVVRFGPSPDPSDPRAPQTPPAVPVPSGPAAVVPAPMPPGAVRPPPVGAGRKVARFITAQAAQSSLKPSSDGKLPELKLGDSGDRPEKEPRSRGMNPLVLFGLLAMSVVASLVLVLADAGPATPTRTLEREEARRIIQADYFAELEDQAPAKPYQLLLREAYQARSRSDFKRERQLYRRVLDLLRADPKPEKGITGSKARDEVLEKQLVVLLSEP